jgi:hypothetical protein
MSATDDRTYADVADKLADWRRMQERWERIYLGNALPIMEVIDRYERGFIDRHALAVEIGDIVCDKTGIAYMRGMDFERKLAEQRGTGG